MLSYLKLFFGTKLSIKTATWIFNNSNLSRKNRNLALRKSGVVFLGKSVINAPFFYNCGNIRLGNGSFVNYNCTMLDNETITIGEKTILGPNVTICTVTHPVDSPNRKETVSEAVTVGNNVWIGASVVILPGVTIGDNSVIAANSVVTSHIPENTLFAGAPAVFKRHINVS
ncbi:DapH/DapD/GlmU-related protein [Pseudescherichia sp.]|uniref:DapH/DapD/GlmU-related protein n=1 Tax=Pseudescherichia sp. TaxID=2055881 RepID=UPI0028965BCE|nr:DapH/DapD/GlmU-related protein [Pseudescherichia sp.]